MTTEIEKLESKTENEEIQPNLQKLDQLAAETKETAPEGAFMQPGQKKKPGRKSNAEKAKIAAEQKKAAMGGPTSQDMPKDPGMATGAIPMPPSAESLMAGKFISKAISNGGVALVGDARASMTPDELEAGAEVLARLMDKYMPEIMGKYGLEASALMIFGQYSLRVASIAKLKKIEEMERMKKKQAEFQNPKTGPEIVPENDNFKSPGINVENI